MTATSGGEAIVNGLVAHGVDTVFGLPGAQVYGLFDADEPTGSVDPTLGGGCCGCSSNCTNPAPRSLSPPTTSR